MRFKIVTDVYQSGPLDFPVCFMNVFLQSKAIKNAPQQEFLYEFLLN